MFAVIDTNGANQILIHIPHAGSEKTLPALASMLENNATFIQKGWRELKIMKPTMSIVLGDRIETEENGEAGVLVVKSDSSVIGDDFVVASPEVFVSNKRSLDKKDAEISKLQKELAFVKDQLSDMQRKCSELAGSDET